MSLKGNCWLWFRLLFNSRVFCILLLHHLSLSCSLSDQVPQKRRGLQSSHILSDDEDIYSKMGAPRNGRKYQFSSNSDAEIEYRRGRSLREERSWRQS